jgi:hypothetical protein
MGFPDRIERTVEVAHPPGKVWAALTTHHASSPIHLRFRRGPEPGGIGHAPRTVTQATSMLPAASRNYGATHPGPAGR